MSEKDPKEHLKTYERFCKPRFESMESNLKDTTKAVNALNAIVTDGLEDKVDDLKKQNIRLMGLLISLLMLIIASTITLYATNNRKYNMVQQELTEKIDEISD